MRPSLPAPFPRFNGSPWFTNKIPDLIGVADRKYLDATGTHLNRGPEDIARYGILVTDKDDGSIGPRRFMSEDVRRLTSRQSDTAMYALARYLSALEPPANPHPVTEFTAQGNVVFVQAQCSGCHTPPLYTNNKLIAVDGFVPPNDAATAALDIMPAARVGTDAGLALRTRKGTGFYKVPSLKGLWYRSPLEHSGSVMSLEEWFDPARLQSDYAPRGWNPPGVKTRAIPGHPFGLGLSSADKQALIAFLNTL
jgi:cytochrome c peroxidase